MTEENERLQTQIGDDGEVSLLDLALVLAKRKRMVFWITFGLAFAVAVYSLVTPPIYRAETRLLPPQSANLDQAASLIENIATGGAAAALTGKTPGDLYVGIVKGRTVLDNVVKRFHLDAVYKAKNEDWAIKRLSENMEAKADLKTGIISIAVMDKDPKRAADVANGLVDALRDVASGLAISASAQKRLYYEQQIRDVQLTLMKSEERLKEYQERSGIQEAGAQTGAQIETMASLRAQIAAKEVELRALRAYATDQNPDVRRVQNELSGLYGQLERLESSQGSPGDPLNPAGGMPEVRLQYLRLLRDVKFNEYLYSLLQRQYEMAKLGEVKDAAVIQVIDQAVPPQIKFKPKRTLMVLLAAVLGFFVSVFGAFFLEFLENAKKDPESAAKLEAFKNYAKLGRDDFRWLSRTRRKRQ